MARATTPVQNRTAVFVRSRRDNKYVYVRRPYDIIELDWKNGGKPTYIQPHCGNTRTPSENEEVYSRVEIFEDYPTWDWFARY